MHGIDIKAISSNDNITIRKKNETKPKQNKGIEALPVCLFY
jgi:hypothetical protein